MRRHEVKVCLMGGWAVALLGIGLGVIEFIRRKVRLRA